MQLLATEGIYGLEGDFTNDRFLRLVNNPPSDFRVLEGNAGLGADWPAAIWRSATGLSLALSILAAPATLEENWPKWKAIFDNMIGFMRDFHGEFRIDRDTAQVIALHQAIYNEGLNACDINMHLAIRHYTTGVGGYEDLLMEDRIDMSWPLDECGPAAFSHGVRSNQEAAKQACCRYIFGISDLRDCRTIVVESDGSISFCSRLRHG